MNSKGPSNYPANLLQTLEARIEQLEKTQYAKPMHADEVLERSTQECVAQLAPHSILEEAAKIISQDRRQEYGPVRESFANIAAKWCVTLGTEVTPEQVALCMIDFKTVREGARHKRDNLVDVCGYAALLQELCE